MRTRYEESREDLESTYQRADIVDTPIWADLSEHFLIFFLLLLSWTASKCSNFKGPNSALPDRCEL
jgi:hypothetical protein